METKFIDLALNKLSKNFKLTEIDLKQDSVMKKKGMTFYNHCYEIDGLGHLSTTSMTGMFGFMKMESVILSVDNKDIPLFNCDYVKVFKKEFLGIELFDDMLSRLTPDYEVNFNVLNYRDKDLKEHVSKKRWYDDIRYSFSYAKDGKNQTKRFLKSTKDSLDFIIEKAKSEPNCDVESKQLKIKEFANNLYSNGGPAVDTFKKAFGDEAAKRMVVEYMYGVRE